MKNRCTCYLILFQLFLPFVIYAQQQNYVSRHLTTKVGDGLNNLDARTKLMQGTMNIDSQPGKGTSVLIEVPYNFNGV